MKRIITLLLVLLLMAGALVGCNQPPVDAPSDPSDLILSEDTFFDIDSAANEAFYSAFSTEEKDLYYNLWAADTVVCLKIDIEPSELYKIQQAYTEYAETYNAEKADTYRRCNLTITVNGEEYYYDEVGIRMRGNTSRRNFCAENGLIYDFVHFRFSLTETFDGSDYKNGAWGSDIYKEWTDADARAARKARTFATMEKFFYKWNKNYDNTYIREIYTNQMFREYGILAPHITLTQIQLKQAGAMHNIGVGGLYEIVDKNYISRNFDETRDGGDLYKCSYPADMVEFVNYGIETATEKFAYDLKTNDDVDKASFNNHRYLQNFIEMLNVADDDELRQQLSEFVDMDYFTRFEAVNFLVGNPDCIRNNKNNYYIYFTPAGKMYLIPYDYDRVFGINMDWNPTGDSMTTLDPLSTNSAVKDTPTVNPLYTRTILKGGATEYQQLYKVKLKGVLNGEWFTYEHFKTMYDIYSSNYSAVAMPSDLIVANCPAIQSHKFRFNEEGTDNLSTQFENMSTERYMELKRAYTLRFV